MPWKNGGGTTFEVAVHPQSADWGSFAWRVSIAEIAAAGRSRRSWGSTARSWSLPAAAWCLRGIREDAVEIRPYDCVTFAGEAQVESRLLDGPTRDFNVMTRRGAARADVRVVRSERLALDNATTYVCHAASKDCACLVDDATIAVPEAHTLVADVRALRRRCDGRRCCDRRNAHPMKYAAAHALLPGGWAERVVIDVDDDGLIRSVTSNADASDERLSGPVVPAMPNLHSHAFQRAIAGRTGRPRAERDDSFWTWRAGDVRVPRSHRCRRVRGDRRAGVCRDG